METRSTSSGKKQGELLLIILVAAILLFGAMATVGPQTEVGRKWQEWNNASSSQQSQTPASGTSIVGGPSLSADRIDQILTNAGSPAAGSGQTFYDDSVTYNVDDAVALAFFKHESGYGKRGAARQTLSVGNIICTDGYTCIGRFRAYSSWSESITDWYKLISGPAYAGGGLKTLDQIIPKYAPASDGNSESSYIAAVQQDVQIWRAA